MAGSDGFGAEPGEPLVGGDVTDGVVRVGETVRRPGSSSSQTVRRVLQQLEAIDFEGAPRWLGIDVLGRDVLSFVPGEVAGRPWPAWVADADRAASVARLVRRLDDAMLLLGVPSWSTAASQPEGDEPPAAASASPSLLGHLDITPENVVFVDGQARALIDFDLVRPTTRLEEVADLLLWWAGWMAPEDRDPALQETDPAERGRLLVDAYGLDDAQRRQLVAVAIHHAARSWHRMLWRAEHLNGGWRRMWDAGVGDRIRRREAWLREQEPLLRSALLG